MLKLKMVLKRLHFLIYTKKQFTEFLSRTKKDGKYYKLMADIKNISGFGTVVITGNLDWMHTFISPEI